MARGNKRAADESRGNKAKKMKIEKNLPSLNSNERSNTSYSISISSSTCSCTSVCACNLNKKPRSIIDSKKGDRIQDNFIVMETIDEGAFGKVFRAFDKLNRRKVALKVLKSPVGKLKPDDFDEVKLQQKLNALDPKNSYNCLKLLDSFLSPDNHLCMVYDAMAMCLGQFLYENLYLPFELPQIKHFASQIFEALKFLHGNNIIHCDIKPGNILLVNIDHDEVFNNMKNRNVKILRNTDIKICDFGLAVTDAHLHQGYRGTLTYCPPEVILGKKWTSSFDVWSAACTLMELYMGEGLFDKAQNFLDLLAAMCKVIGRFPRFISKESSQYIDVNGNVKHNPEQIALMNQFHKNLIYYKTGNDVEHTNFFHLIKQMFRYNPDRRVNFNTALNHPFFNSFKK